jgi:hypothetical protein
LFPSAARCVRTARGAPTFLRRIQRIVLGGFLAPRSDLIPQPVNGKWWYFANTPSAAVPDGFGQEETIREIWANQG